MSVLGSVVNRSVTQSFQSSTFWSALKSAVQNFLTDPHIVSDVVTRLIDASAVRVPVISFVKIEFEERSPNKTGMKQHSDAFQ